MDQNVASPSPLVLCSVFVNSFHYIHTFHMLFFKFTGKIVGKETSVELVCRWLVSSAFGCWWPV